MIYPEIYRSPVSLSIWIANIQLTALSLAPLIDICDKVR
ncbi:hypothetical protein D1AOALGA4SA_8736 [Olavius algarvensis Delta 1 endosymbiont]|nr:hypothetical protein D1AOALGA4SA_8736 [Olavius algarvensis Delta 1 endosymbiont]